MAQMKTFCLSDKTSWTIGLVNSRYVTEIQQTHWSEYKISNFQQNVHDAGDFWQQDKCEWEDDEEEANVDGGAIRRWDNGLPEVPPREVPDRRQVRQCHLRERGKGG